MICSTTTAGMRRKMPLFATAVFLAVAPFSVAGAPHVRHAAEFVPIAALASRTPPAAGAPENCPLPAASVRVGKFEVTNTEYAAFLNAVARSSDPYGLFSPLQSVHFWGGINRQEREGEFVYAVKPGYGELPATYVSAHDAIRFANWLHYGRPSTGKSEQGTTEGTASSGAYDTHALGGAALGPQRNAAARYFLPTCGEWMAAGFFDAESNAFTQYSAGTTAPAAGADDAALGRSANYYAGQWALPFPHLARVTSYANNESASGTRNQAGNVMEWVEGAAGHNQLALGGSLFLPKDTLTKAYRDSELPNKKLSSFGFRIASAIDISEPLVFVAPLLNTLAPSTAPPPRPRAVAIEWTRIDRPGNTSDFRSGHGCVAKSFEMARTEVTNAQYATFLNAVAGRGDPHHLYLDDMSTGVGGGITRTRHGERASYAAKPGYDDRPAAYLSWFALARLANWHHFGRPTGAQVVGVTEGSASIGAYNTAEFASFEAGDRKRMAAATSLLRNPGAKYFLPSNDEWYKAAYYDPERPGLRKYWSYPNRSDDPPGNSPDGNGANYQTEDLGEGAPYYLSRAGEFAGRGYYDLADMGGNLWEWLETWRGLGGQPGWRRDIPTKGLRGGSFNYIDTGLSFRNIDPGYPTDHYFVYGGRLARSVPVEPAESGWCLPPSVRGSVTSAAQFFGRPKVLGLAVVVLLVAFVTVAWRRIHSRRR